MKTLLYLFLIKSLHTGYAVYLQLFINAYTESKTINQFNY